MLSTQPINSFNLYSAKESSRKTLYSVSFIFLIIEIALTTLIGIGGVGINLSRILTTDDGWKPLLDFFNNLTYDNWRTQEWKGILIFILLAFHTLQLIALFWLIPITVINGKCIKRVGTKREQKHTSLGICTLLFTGNLISGILLIVAASQTPNYKIGN